MILGLDVGTTSVSGVLVSPDCWESARSMSRPHEADVPQLPAGCHEQCPKQILAIALDVIRALAEQAEAPIRDIALTGQMHGIVAVDEELNPLTNLITWRDQRTAEYSCQHPYISETGCLLHPGYGGLTLHHLLHTETLPKATHKVLSLPGFVAAHLTGRRTVDETFAASWGIWNLVKGDWHHALLESLGIPATLLPEYVPSCKALGTVLDAEDLGLESGTVVYSPMGDNQAGVAGVLEPGEPEGVVNVGTSGQFSLPAADYTFSPQLETRPYPGGRFLQVYAALCGGWSYTYLARFFQQVIEHFSESEVALVDVMERMQDFCQSTDANGLQVDARFAGERHGTQPCGSVSGIDTENLTPQNLTRGFVTAIAAELALVAKKVDLSGIRGLIAVGNAVHKTPLLLTALEEQFGLPCRLVSTSEEAALGAAKSVLNMKNL